VFRLFDFIILKDMVTLTQASDIADEEGIYNPKAY
jgi:hypothetical protein